MNGGNGFAHSFHHIPLISKEDEQPLMIDRCLLLLSMSCVQGFNRMRFHTSWELRVPSTTAFGLGKCRASSYVCGKPSWSTTMNWSALPGTGKVWIVRGHQSLLRYPAVGYAPTGRGKQGTKRNLLCDRRGLPLALSIEGAKGHESKLLFSTLNAMSFDRPEPTVVAPQNLYLDATCDHDLIYADLYERGYEPHVRLNPSTTNDTSHQRTMPRAWNTAKCLDDGSSKLFLLAQSLASPAGPVGKARRNVSSFLHLACERMCIYYTSLLSVFA